MTVQEEGKSKYGHVWWGVYQLTLQGWPADKTVNLDRIAGTPGLCPTHTAAIILLIEFFASGFLCFAI